MGLANNSIMVWRVYDRLPGTVLRCEWLLVAHTINSTGSSFNELRDDRSLRLSNCKRVFKVHLGSDRSMALDKGRNVLGRESEKLFPLII